MTPDPDPTAPRPDYDGSPESGEGEPSEPFDPFDQLVWGAVDSLPDAFRERLDTVAIVVEDEPSLDELRRTGAPGLLGLYTGVPRTAYGASEAPMPSKITIYRGPHLRNFGDGPALAEGVAATVRHEVAHHFGISDARLEQMAREARRGH
jgi:predicted Zn-dependent protease with MMP-like domain